MSSNPCSYAGLHPPKAFVFQTTQTQNASNTVYLNAQAAGVKRFKSDAERMQYLMGQRARDANCCNGNCTTTG